jgi:hypothetical protein
MHGDHGLQIESRRSPTVRLPGPLYAGLPGPHVNRCLAEEVFSVVANLGNIGSRPGRPDAARKRFPLLENGFDIRQNEIRQAHSA